MTSVFDYLKWRGDLSFSQDPLNPVDGLIFSVLSYIPFVGQAAEKPHEPIALRDAAADFLSLDDYESRVRAKNDAMMLRAAAETARFGGCKMVLYRDELVAPEYAGVPVAVENELVVLQRQTNFVLDGYCALRTGDITEAEQMDDVPFLKKVMAGEKLYDAVKAPGFACRSWQELLEGIMAQYGGWAAVECEGNPEESLYFLGRLMKVDSRYLTMKRVDALGNWLSDPLVLPLDDVTLVSFGDRYLEIFRKYCK